MDYGLIGEKLSHSFSPEIHRLLADYDYRLCPMPPDQLAPFLEKRDFRGVNVTIPYKRAVMPYLDHIDPKAQAIGAVNTIVNRNGVLTGYNTDFDGLEGLLRRTGLDLKGRSVLILGTGGTSRTAMAVARHLGAAAVARASRDPKGEDLSYSQARDFPARIVINTTPAGMFPDPEGLPMDLSPMEGLEGVADVIFNPLRTRLVLEAREKGARSQGGLYMLVAQAAAAAQLFLDKKLPEGALERAYQTIRGQKQNIVLIGMPGSGKSTVGRVLARQLGRELMDSDNEVVRKTRRAIPEIFAQRGEAGFRQEESQVIRELSRSTGMVIATGGGSILREENLRRLRQNGRLYFLDRPLKDLLPTADRPLAQTAEAVRQRYQERYPRYLACADAVIPVEGEPETVAEAIRKEFFQ